MTGSMIEVRDLTKYFGGLAALGGISFAVPRGQVVGLLGPNGAGKTTAMRILTGYVAPTGGEAFIDGMDVVEDSMACRRRIGYLPEGNPLYLELRVEEALAFASRMMGIPSVERGVAIDRSMERAGLLEMRRRLCGTLSKGYRQRVGLAQALLHDPDVLILDEPTSGLDPNQQGEMRALIRELGEKHTVLLSTHVLSEVEAACDRALIIHRGLLVEDGSVAELKQRSREPTAVLTVRGEPAAAHRAFAGLPYVGEVTVDPLPRDPHVLRVRVSLPGGLGRETLEGLAHAAIGGGLPLSGLETEIASLEQIFGDLTREEDLAPPGGGGPDEAADVPAGVSTEED